MKLFPDGLELIDVLLALVGIACLVAIVVTLERLLH